MAGAQDPSHVLWQADPETRPHKGDRWFASKLPPFVPEDRIRHADGLAGQVQATEQTLAEQLAARIAADQIQLQSAHFYLDIEGHAGYDLPTDTFHAPTKHIELCNVRQIQEPGTAPSLAATLRVSGEGLHELEQRIVAYREGRPTRRGSVRPPYELQLNAIESITPGTIRSLWTDELALLPEGTQERLWQLWVRQLGHLQLNELLTAVHLELVGVPTDIGESTIITVRCTRQTLESAIALSSIIEEIRYPPEQIGTFLQMNPMERREWVRQALPALEFRPRNDSVICILDTGINEGHLLLSPAVVPGGVQRVHPNIALRDINGHGTSVAGLCIFGDALPRVIFTNERFICEHRLESIKLQPDAAFPEVESNVHHYTAASVSLAEAANPRARRAFCCTITSNKPHNGLPTAWSSQIDRLAFGTNGQLGRLFLLAAGNARGHVLDLRGGNYPGLAVQTSVHDPCQSWNSIVIGGIASSVERDAILPDHVPMATVGQLHPNSTTSFVWPPDAWPVRPDVVCPAGNLALHDGDVAAPDSMQLLSTGARSSTALDAFHSTSAATALAANIAARVTCAYPRFWPETLRGLMIHSARWSAEMEQQANAFAGQGADAQTKLATRLALFGWGAPSLQRAVSSAKDDLTLIVQHECQPFTETKKFNEWHLWKLPWPENVLNELGESQVSLRVTLSYFIEPRPRRRGWRSKFPYQSHGFRFKLTQRGTVTESYKHGADRGWMLGDLRNRGSVHSDLWTGKAIDLARWSWLRIKPTGGWWKDSVDRLARTRNARYSLIVNIMTPPHHLGVLNEVRQKIAVQPAIPVQIRL